MRRDGRGTIVSGVIARLWVLKVAGGAGRTDAGPRGLLLAFIPPCFAYLLRVPSPDH